MVTNDVNINVGFDNSAALRKINETQKALEKLIRTGNLAKAKGINEDFYYKSGYSFGGVNVYKNGRVIPRNRAAKEYSKEYAEYATETLMVSRRNAVTKESEKIAKKREAQERTAQRNVLMGGLGIMFFGMAIQRSFEGMMRPALEVAGIFEIFSTALELLFLPIALFLLEPMIKFLEIISALPEPIKFIVGAITLLIATIGAALMILGQMSLGTMALGMGALPAAVAGVASGAAGAGAVTIGAIPAIAAASTVGAGLVANAILQNPTSVGEATMSNKGYRESFENGNLIDRLVNFVPAGIEGLMRAIGIVFSDPLSTNSEMARQPQPSSNITINNNNNYNPSNTPNSQGGLSIAPLPQ